MKRFSSLLWLYLCFWVPGVAYGSFTANRVWFEYHQGFYRVIVHYTVPELKELREATFDVVNKRKAEIFYFSLLRGAHFDLSGPDSVQFSQERGQADPW